MALEQKLENIDGNLRDAYKQCVPGTVLCVDQLMTERRTNPELRNLWFYTADGEVYSMDKETPTLRITREAVNPVLKNIDDAFEQLVNKENYKVIPADFEAVKIAPDTVAVDLTKLKLKGDEKEWCYLAVDTSKPIAKYNEEQQKLLLRVFGPTDEDYITNTELLRTSPQKITETRVYVLAPDYVKANAKKGPIGRASWLLNFNSDSYFDAAGRFVNFQGRFRGVRREVVAAGDAPKKAVPSAPLEIVAPSMGEILTLSRQYVPECGWKQWQEDLRKKYKC